MYASEKENGRVFHAMTYARQAFERGDSSGLYFAADGTVWPGLLADNAHPMHELFTVLKETGVIQGACKNCAVAFGNKQTARCEVELLAGTESGYGQIDILDLEDQRFRIWLF